ncbi:MAG: hypothetical protein J6Q68_01000 [Clostridia bacterium]|nr:hypothetical protein [Clostridia bacterium]
MEKRYEFKRELLNVHKDYRRDFSRKPNENEIEVCEPLAIIIPKNADKVTENAARDFAQYLYTSMKIGSIVTSNDGDYKQKLIISVDSDIDEAAKGYMGYSIDVTDTEITLQGYDSIGAAQGLYFLEDLMNIRKAPFLTKRKIARKAIFEKRTSQSPFGMFEWTDEALSTLSHFGMNSISLWIRDVNLDNRGGYIDINLLAERAKKYGIGIGIQLYAEHNVHPTEEGAQEFYDKLYGRILKTCPDIERIELVGETTHFKSKDPRVSNGSACVDNIPTGKRTAGWFPCSDYPEWVEMIKKAATKYNPEIDIHFSTYNWGFVNEKDRIALIDNLPADISIGPTWEMFEIRPYRNSVEYQADYSLNFDGPGKYFISEAVAAKRRGIKVTANAQSSGRTWDFGVVPYEPMPYRWMKRYEGLVKAHYEWGVDGVCENIHYGFQPSIISELEKYMFFTEYEGAPTPEEWLKLLIARDFGEENVETVDSAFRDFSEAILHYPATNEDQYGAFRIGPAYPLWIIEPRTAQAPPPQHGKKPNEYNAMFGNGIYFSGYTPEFSGKNSLPGVRIGDEIDGIGELASILKRGLDKLDGIKDESENLTKLRALVKFMINSCKTTINSKKLYLYQNELALCKTKERAATLLDELEALILSERDNVLDTIPVVREDSRLGWEASMEYQCDEECLNWKLRQLDHEINITLPNFRKSNSL